MELITYHILRYKDSDYSGILLKKSHNWTLIKNNVVDYVLDGFRLINNKYMSHECEIPEGDITHRILRRKYDIECDRQMVDAIDMEDDVLLFSYFQTNDILLAIGTNRESVVYVGKVLKVNRCSCEFQLYDKEYNVCNRSTFKYNQIRYIEVDTDYVRSLSLLDDCEVTE